LITPPLPKNEIQRLLALKKFELLDTAAEEVFDDLTKLASQIFATPMALITLVDESRQWFKSCVGIAATETPRDISFCGHAILGQDLFEVADALLDERFADNPLVTGDPNVRFYAGMPLITTAGYALGTLCIIDTVPRQLTTAQRESIKMLARQAITQIEYHLTLLQITALNQQLIESASFHDTLLDSVEQSIISIDTDGIITSFNAGAEAILGYQADELVGKKTLLILHDADEISQCAAGLGLIPAQTPQSLLEIFMAQSKASAADTCECSYVHKDGSHIAVSLMFKPMHDHAGELIGFLAVARDIRSTKKAQKSLAEMADILQHTGEMAKVGGWSIDLTTMQLTWSSEVYRIYELESTKPPAVEEAIGYYLPEDQLVITAAVALAISDGVPWDLEQQLITAKGNQIWVRAQGAAVIENGKAIGLKGVFQDITERKKNRLDLAKINRALTMVSKCNEVMMHISDEKQLIVDVCRIIVEVGGYKVSWVGYAESDAGQSITVQACFGNANDDLLNQKMRWLESHEHIDTPAAKTIRNSQVTMVGDVMLDPDYANKTLALQLGYRALVYLPLNNKGLTFGVLGLYAAEPRIFGQDEIRLLQELADNLVSGIVNIRAETERDQLSAAMLNMATALSAHGGDRFFAQLVSNMTTALAADGAYVAELIAEQPWQGRTIALQVDGEVMANYDYHISDGLFDRLFGEGDICIVTEDAARDYADLSMMRFYQYEAFAALRLRSSSNEALGLIFVLFKQPIKAQFYDRIVAMLKIFSSRTANELERMQAEALIQEQAALLDKTRDAIVVRDLEHKITYWNKGAETLYGWTAAEAIGKHSYSLFKHELDAFDHAVKQLRATGEWVGELVKRHKSGARLVIEAHWTLVNNKQGQAGAIFSFESNISERKTEDEKIRQLAFYDPLTQLSNRRLLMSRLEQALAKVADNKEYGALIFIDMDNFKKLNDTMGHEEGDLLLKTVASSLKASVRENDTVARLGGDEFVVMMEDLSVIRSQAMLRATTIANKILAKLDITLNFDGYAHHSSCSLGIALFNHQTKSIGDLLKQADTAMYQAKADGRNTLSIFE
jgi:diguanylate cyclase (GGDEF)-like protein/PAS domain S-box-containing protein